jgi:hypothetical protein
MLLLAACLPALADEVPQPEGGKKFEGCWAFACGLAEIVYEEEGYRVSVDLYNMNDSDFPHRNSSPNLENTIRAKP